jgi:hypothetical protein
MIPYSFDFYILSLVSMYPNPFLFMQPSEIACYSRIEGGDVYFDDRSLVRSQNCSRSISLSL